MHNYTLANGADIVDIWDLHDGTFGVLAKRSWNTYHPFVVWRGYPSQVPGQLNCEHGSYCETLAQAVKVLERRFGELRAENQARLVKGGA